MRWRRREPVPAPLVAALPPGERLLAGARTSGGSAVAASRFGLWVADDDHAERWDWHLISKVRLAGGTLRVLVADEVAVTEEGIAVLQDRPEQSLHFEYPTRLTDTVHDRVRRSVAASRYLSAPVGGWVVLRRVPGRDGLTAQFRPESGADIAVPMRAESARAVADAVVHLWPAEVPRGNSFRPE